MTKPDPVATPPVVPTADDILTQAAARLDVAKHQVERALAEANIALTTPAPSDRRLRILRLRVDGIKHDGEPFTIDRPFEPGIWAIVHPENSAGKTSLLEFLVWPLRGAPRDLPPGVRSWVRTLHLDLVVAGKPTRIALEQIPGLLPPVSVDILTADTVQALLAAADDNPLRLVAKGSGTDDVERVIGSFFLDALRMERTSLWSATGGADGEGAPQVHGWPAYFGACYLNAGGDELLLGDVSAPGLPAKLLERFVDIPYSSAHAQLSVAVKGRAKTTRQAQRRAEGDLHARSAERAQWQAQLDLMQQEIQELSGAPETDIAPLLQRADQAAQELHRLRMSLNGAAQSLADAAAARVGAEQAQLDAQETWQARRVLGRLNPSCCPRCEEPVGDERRAAERDRATCAVCTRPLPEIAEDIAEAVLEQLTTDIATALEAEAAAAAHHRAVQASADAAVTAHQQATEAVSSALAASPAHVRLRELELTAAELKGRLAATGTAPPATPTVSAVPDVLSAVHQLVEATVKASADYLFPTMDSEIVSLSSQFGVQHLNSVTLKRNGNVNPVKEGVKHPFKKLSRGDRLRMRVATVIALLRAGAARHIDSHPGLLLIDSVAAEEMTADAARRLIDELQTLTRELPELQVVFTTAQPELVEGLLPEDHIITSDSEHLF
uniref:Putative large ATP-binding protein n=1 Tax=Streptomyces violaceoruber TaxID=1935 RepID=Q849N4_STRVN|nr:putative large ATP-binding protein [Streptomyces violaceoruber]